MNIEKIKINGIGYLVNDVLLVPTLTDDIKQWLSEGNIPEPEFSEKELLEQFQNKFRADRDTLLTQVDIEINKAEDSGLDSTDLRLYRQALRDATIEWVMPESIL